MWGAGVEMDGITSMERDVFSAEFEFEFTPEDVDPFFVFMLASLASLVVLNEVELHHSEAAVADQSGECGVRAVVGFLKGWG